MPLRLRSSYSINGMSKMPYIVWLPTNRSGRSCSGMLSKPYTCGRASQFQSRYCGISSSMRSIFAPAASPVSSSSDADASASCRRRGRCWFCCGAAAAPAAAADEDGDGPAEAGVAVRSCSMARCACCSRVSLMSSCTASLASAASVASSGCSRSCFALSAARAAASRIAPDSIGFAEDVVAVGGCSAAAAAAAAVAKGTKPYSPRTSASLHPSSRSRACPASRATCICEPPIRPESRCDSATEGSSRSRSLAMKSVRAVILASSSLVAMNSLIIRRRCIEVSFGTSSQLKGGVIRARF
mmetsp:Transcript_11121/g.36603  ORF Transcript_11121/g.36603 Transcript_11121/m.36603 type:complete len:299 (-) Transcript_11121:319-1215(-)